MPEASETNDDVTTTTGDDGKPDTGAAGTSSAGDRDWKADAEKWKELARKHEERAKANAGAVKELEDLKKASMTETEKAVSEAKAAGMSEGLAKGQARLVAAEVRAAAAGRLPAEQLKELVDGLDLAKFVGDDGDVDEAKVKKLIDAVAPGMNGKRNTDLGQGARGSNGGPAGMNALVRSRMAR